MLCRRSQCKKLLLRHEQQQVALRQSLRPELQSAPSVASSLAPQNADAAEGPTHAAEADAQQRTPEEVVLASDLNGDEPTAQSGVV